MLNIDPSESIENASDRIIATLPATVSKVKWPPYGDVGETLWVYTPDESYAQRLAAYLDPILAEISERADMDDGRLPVLQRRYGVRMTVKWPSPTQNRRVVEIHVATVPLVLVPWARRRSARLGPALPAAG